MVAQTRSEVTCVQPGDRIQIAPGLPCGTCSYCQMGMDNLCDQVKIMGFHYDGGFGEYVLVPENGGYLRKTETGCQCVSLEKATVVNENGLKEMDALAEDARKAGYHKFYLIELIITEGNKVKLF